jgi:prophage maintenance system killer protein
MTVRFLDPDEVDRQYAAELRGGESLGNTVSKPRWVQLMEDESDLVVLAAALLRAVNDRHALIDGNKRASMRLTDEFLALNGHRLDGPPAVLTEIGWTAGAHGYETDAALADVLRPLAVEGAPDAPFDERFPEVIDKLAR